MCSGHKELEVESWDVCKELNLGLCSPRAWCLLRAKSLRDYQHKGVMKTMVEEIIQGASALNP